jgi:hypothetical protein
MSIDWNTLLQTLGSTAVLVAPLGYLGQTVIKLWMDRDLAAYKATLNAQAQEKLEELKTELRVKADAALAKTNAGQVGVQKEVSEFQSRLMAQSSRQERVAAGARRWSHDIDVVEGLRSNIGKILSVDCSLALDACRSEPVTWNTAAGSR